MNDDGTNPVAFQFADDWKDGTKDGFAGKWGNRGESAPNKQHSWGTVVFDLNDATDNSMMETKDWYNFSTIHGRRYPGEGAPQGGENQGPMTYENGDGSDIYGTYDKHPGLADNKPDGSWNYNSALDDGIQNPFTWNMSRPVGDGTDKDDVIASLRQPLLGDTCATAGAWSIANTPDQQCTVMIAYACPVTCEAYLEHYFPGKKQDFLPGAKISVYNKDQDSMSTWLWGTTCAQNFASSEEWCSDLVTQLLCPEACTTGPTDIIRGKGDTSQDWAAEWVSAHTRDGKFTSKKQEDLYRLAQSELSQNGYRQWSPGAFPELGLDETYRYFKGETWPRTETEYRYSFDKWTGKRAGTYVGDIHTDWVHKYKFGSPSGHGPYNYAQEMDQTTYGQERGKFAKISTGGDQEVYLPDLEFTWIADRKYEALGQVEENRYKYPKVDNSKLQRYGRTNGSSHFLDPQGFQLDTDQPNSFRNVSSLQPNGHNQNWNWQAHQQNGGMYDRDRPQLYEAGGSKYRGWVGETKKEKCWRKRHDEKAEWEEYTCEGILYNEDGSVAFGPNGLALTTNVGDRLGWNTNVSREDISFEELDSHRTWDFNVPVSTRKV